jgi:nucleoside-diphosphate-sugar epimerase
MFISFFNCFKKEPFILSIDKLKEIFKKGWICDIMNVRNVLNYEPKYNLDKGLELTINWYKTNRWL